MTGKAIPVKLSRTEPPSVTDRIPIIDNGEPLVDLREVAPDMVIPEKTHYTERPLLPYVRKSVADKLARAQELLTPNYRLWLSDAYRPIDVQREQYEQAFAETKEKHPEWSDRSIRRHLNRWIAPVDKRTPPPHSTGGAVDLSLVDWEKNEMDLDSSAIKEASTADINSKNLTEAARKNRQIMIDALTAAGLTNYPSEWWHWTYGDSGWAYRTGAPYAIYGPLEGIPPNAHPVPTRKRRTK